MKEECKHEKIAMMFYNDDRAGTKCLDCEKESTPPNNSKFLGGTARESRGEDNQ